jgi:hypothetical protein
LNVKDIDRHVTLIKVCWFGPEPSLIRKAENSEENVNK